MTVLLVLLALAAGVAAGWFLARTRGAADVVRLQATLDAERSAAADRNTHLRETFQALSADALQQNGAQFLQMATESLKVANAESKGDLAQRQQAVEHMVAPLKEALGKVESQLREIEQARVRSQTSLVEQVRFVRETGEQLRHETSALVTALRKPQARGRWGELQLRRVVELAGMINRCDFVEQESAASDDGLMRPDLVVKLVGGKSIVVDSKVTLSAYLEASEIDDETQRGERLAAHARHLRKHVDDLAAKAYWQQFTPAPEFVVLFVPGEAFLAPALDVDPMLLDYAFGKRVHIATPTTLVSVLRSVAYAWQQDALADNAEKVFALGRELYSRLATLGTHFDKLGRSLDGAVRDYNKTVSSIETRVLVSARQLNTLGVTQEELATPTPSKATTQRPTAAELVAGADIHLLPTPPDPAAGHQLDLEQSADTG